MGDLRLARDRLLAEGISRNSLRTYQSGFNRFQRFCFMYRFVWLPPQELHLELFVTSLARQGLQYNTIKVYLYGIQFCALQQGVEVRIASMRRLYYVCRGIRRTQVARRRTRNPITPAHLRQMLSFISSSQLSAYDQALWKCLVLTAFFGLLRVSEYTSASSRSFDPLTNLCVSDVSLQGPSVLIRIKASKTDPFRVGTSITLWEGCAPLCPVNAISSFYFFRITRPPGPFFVLESGEYITRSHVTRFLNSSLRDVNISTHSFRIGGASAASSAGIPDSVIQLMGRWRSNCFVSYIHLNNTTRRNWSREIGQVRELRSVWNDKN